MTIRYFRHPELTLDDDVWCDMMAEKYFDSSNDIEQAHVEDCSFDISKLFPYAWTVVKANDERIGYTYILPATKALMDRFIDGKINEGEVIRTINKDIRYHNCDAAYLAGAVFIDGYVNRGYAVRVAMDTIRHMDEERGMKIMDLYIWPFTDAMNSMIGKATVLAEKDGRRLHIFGCE